MFCNTEAYRQLVEDQWHHRQPIRDLAALAWKLEQAREDAEPDPIEFTQAERIRHARSIANEA